MWFVLSARVTEARRCVRASRRASVASSESAFACAMRSQLQPPRHSLLASTGRFDGRRESEAAWLTSVWREHRTGLQSERTAANETATVLLSVQQWGQQVPV